MMNCGKILVFLVNQTQFHKHIIWVPSLENLSSGLALRSFSIEPTQLQSSQNSEMYPPFKKDLNACKHVLHACIKKIVSKKAHASELQSHSK